MFLLYILIYIFLLFSWDVAYESELVQRIPYVQSVRKIRLFFRYCPQNIQIVEEAAPTLHMYNQLVQIKTSKLFFLFYSIIFLLFMVCNQF